jgi:Flp pilus assembly protein TadG
MEALQGEIVRKRFKDDRVTPRRRQRGQSLAEFAIVMPIFLVLVMGIVDFGMGLKSWISITNAAREAARWGAIHCSSGDYTNSDVEQRAIDTATGLDTDMLDATVDTAAGVSCDDSQNSTQSLVVNVDYEYKLITPLAGMLSFLGGGASSSINLSSSADMRIE